MRLPLMRGVAVLFALGCNFVRSESLASHANTQPNDLSFDRLMDQEAVRAPVVDPNDLLPESAESAAPAPRPIPHVWQPSLDQIVDAASGVYLTKFKASDPQVRQQVTSVLRHKSNLGPKPGVGKFLSNAGTSSVAVPLRRNADEVAAVTIVFASPDGTAVRKVTMSVSGNLFGRYGITVARLAELLREHDVAVAKH